MLNNSSKYHFIFVNLFVTCLIILNCDDLESNIEDYCERCSNIDWGSDNTKSCVNYYDYQVKNCGCLKNFENWLDCLEEYNTCENSDGGKCLKINLAWTLCPDYKCDD